MSKVEVKQLKFEGLIHQDKKGCWVAKRGFGAIMTHGYKGRGHCIFLKRPVRAEESINEDNCFAEKYGL